MLPSHTFLTGLTDTQQIHIHSLFMCVKGGVSKTFPIILSKKFAVHEADVVNFITRAASVCSLPLFWRCLSLPVTSTPHHKKALENMKFQLYLFAPFLDYILLCSVKPFKIQIQFKHWLKYNGLCCHRKIISDRLKWGLRQGVVTVFTIKLSSFNSILNCFIPVKSQQFANANNVESLTNGILFAHYLLHLKLWNVKLGPVILCLLGFFLVSLISFFTSLSYFPYKLN